MSGCVEWLKQREAKLSVVFALRYSPECCIFSTHKHSALSVMLYFLVFLLGACMPKTLLFSVIIILFLVVEPTGSLSDLHCMQVIGSFSDLHCMQVINHAV